MTIGHGFVCLDYPAAIACIIGILALGVWLAQSAERRDFLASPHRKALEDTDLDDLQSAPSSPQR